MKARSTACSSTTSARACGLAPDGTTGRSEEQDAWTDGNIELVRRIDASRRRINPNFIVITNNSGIAATRAVSPANNTWMAWCSNTRRSVPITRTTPAGTFSDLGHRRVLVIARNDEEAMEWSHVPGVTHVASQHEYSHPGPPLLPFTALTDRPKLPH